MRLHWLCVLLAGSACGSCKKQEQPGISRDPVIDAGDAGQKTTGSVGSCFEPRSILRHELLGSGALLDDDPLTPSPSDHHDDRDGETIAHFGSRVFELAGNVVTAQEGNDEIWRTTIADPLGGHVELRLSPAGRVVIVRVKFDPQFHPIVLDAKSGHVLGTIEALTFAPNDAYGIEVPLAHDLDASLVVFLEPLVRRGFAHFPVDSVSDVSGYPVVFGAEICSNGATFAVSFPTTELAVYRAKDGRKLAAFPNPGSGFPVFSRSGRFIALQVRRSEVMTVAMFELVP